MTILSSVLMLLTGLIALLSVFTQILAGSRGRPLLISGRDFSSYVCLSTAGLALFLVGWARVGFGPTPWMVLAVGPWMVGMIRLVQMHRSARFAPRACECCGFSMVRMTEGERFLSRRQRIEEKLHARHYDLWVCTCGHREMYVYPGTSGTLFRRCPACAVSAVYDISQTVTAEGVFVEHRCAACDTHFKFMGPPEVF